MQTLGLSDSTPGTESRLKALFWPTIRNDGDLDYITGQGFWICVIISAMGLVLSLLITPFSWPLAAAESLFFYLAGNGMRMRSRGAAVLAFTAYLLGALVLQKYTGNGFSIVRIIFLALLLANIRGIWLSASWVRDASEPPLVRLNETWRDKLCDQFPGWLWPKTRVVFYVVAAIEIGLLLLELFPIVMPGPNLG